MTLQAPDSYLPYFNFRDWQDENTEVISCGDLSVVVWTDDTGDLNTTPSCEAAANNEIPALGFCHLEALVPFTDARNIPVLHAYEGAMGIFLALQHLNTGNGSIVDQVDGLNETCRIRFPTEHFFDTQYNPRRTFSYVDQRTSQRSSRIAPFFQPRPTGFVGAFASTVTALSAYISSLRGLPQVSGQSTSSELDNKLDFPLFARSIPNEEFAARNLLLWWTKELQLTHVAVIHTSDMHGLAYARSLRTFVRQMEEDVSQQNRIEILYISIDEDGKNIPEVLAALKTSQFRYVFGVLQSRNLHDLLMEAAFAEGLAGHMNQEYNWFFSDTFRSVLVNHDQRIFPKGSPLHLAYRGVGFIEPASFGTYTETSAGRNEKFERLKDSIREIRQSQDQIEYLRTILPVDNETGTIPYLESSQMELVYNAASFLYEATIMMGLAVCREASAKLSIQGKDFYRSILETVFEGITGQVILNQTTGSRLSTATSYSILNFVDVKSNKTGENGEEMMTFQSVLTHHYSFDNYGKTTSNGSGWVTFKNFTFNHGTGLPQSIPSAPDPLVYISNGMQAFAYVLYSILILLTLGCVSWTWCCRKTRVVMASQPFFLNLICVGIVLVASTIVPMVIDHQSYSLSGNSVSCNATIWLAALGLGIVFSALFAKTHRINRIMNSANKFRRIKVTVRETMISVIVVVCANLIVLSVMTALEPIEYEIEDLSFDSFNRPTTSVGHCNFSNSSSFLIALVVINFGTLLVALYQAWHARSLSTEFAESRYIAYALAGSLIAAFIGCPVLILAKENPNATAFVACALVFLVCSMILYMIFVPKMKYQRDLLGEKDRGVLPTIKVSGLPNEAFGLTLGDVSSEALKDSDQLTEEGGSGEKILTSKSPEELVKEMKLLKCMLLTSRKTVEDQAVQITEFKSLLEANNIALQDALDAQRSEERAVNNEDESSNIKTDESDES
ncbi:7 transmembrane sweet-taste receptor of 3 GCPR [Nitzschia inconspicua]|uniref:7 transmembrane sweet-taste receptor of 3 GCPR n=1 Tax=Nitzschia inconspicua TaxID=303405 RepID=A0A9K3M637_9STRA|nr:7 transmembrane sweet-taste receptor of 3 GCPR [Nitzschia inconspicua]